MKGCRPLGKDEWERTFKAVQGRHALRTKALMILLAKTGFRISEALSLRIGDVVEAGKVKKRISIDRKNMKGGKVGKASGRDVPLHYAVIPHLTDQWSFLKDHGYWRPDCYFFQSQKSGNVAITRQRAWKDFTDALRHIGIMYGVGTHGLGRKTFAKEKLDYLRDKWEPGKEIPVHTLQRCTGHKTIDSLMAYIEFADEDVEDAFLNS